jgi:hypothetical protein
MRRLALCLVLTMSLAPAGAAFAKEPVKAKVCGASDCRETKDRGALMALTEGGPPTTPPSHGAAWYRVTMTIEIDRGRHDTFPMAIVPSEGLMRGGDGNEGYTWMPVSTAAAREYRRITRGLEPRAASALEGIGAPDAPSVRVDEVVLPREEPRADGGGASPLPWIAGGVLLLAVAGLLIRRRGLPWPKPAAG